MPKIDVKPPGSAQGQQRSRFPDVEAAERPSAPEAFIRDSISSSGSNEDTGERAASCGPAAPSPLSQSLPTLSPKAGPFLRAPPPSPANASSPTSASLPRLVKQNSKASVSSLFSSFLSSSFKAFGGERQSRASVSASDASGYGSRRSSMDSVGDTSDPEGGADLSLDVLMSAFPSRQMLIQYCNEHFQCPQKPRFLDQVNTLEKDGKTMPAKEACRFCRFLLDAFITFGAPQDLQLSSDARDETVGLIVAFLEHHDRRVSGEPPPPLSPPSSPTSNHKSLLPKVSGAQQSKKDVGGPPLDAAAYAEMWRCFRPAVDEVTDYLNTKVMPKLRCSDVGKKMHRSSQDWDAINSMAF